VLVALTPALVFASQAGTEADGATHGKHPGVRHKEPSRTAWRNLSSALVVDPPRPLLLMGRPALDAQPSFTLLLASPTIFVPPRG